MEEREDSRMIPRFLNHISGRMELETNCNGKEVSSEGYICHTEFEMSFRYPSDDVK